MATNRNSGKGRTPGCMFEPVGGLGKKYAIINKNKFYIVENLFTGIQEREGMIIDENKHITEEAYHNAVGRGVEMLFDPEMVRAVVNMIRVESKIVTNDSIQEIIRDMQNGAIVEEVEYDDIETKVTEEGVEDVIYVRGITQSIFTSKTEKEKEWRVFRD